MILDEHTPCPACPQVVRDSYALSWRLLAALVGARAELRFLPECIELAATLDALKVWVDAHYANQLHSHSITLEDARAPQLTVVPVDHEGSPR